jgi:hypothetical protein
MITVSQSDCKVAKNVISTFPLTHKIIRVQLLASAQEWFVDLSETLRPSDNPTDTNHADLSQATLEVMPV